ncbi:beta-phosphoglucomutase [Stenomitos frigidus]|uniref:Beta-phosphoglucomutase n=1 Tax=Stenomitos frigidus ULC18 TaxID=2107698 RepID=A0A2T1EJC0_9CYAN|nr:beta-phosphoglucomutase [Stenomitos frigidus]PSB32791.1 beta-phosphoglucomutase [Stenomitos frigidus ULC18]
MNTTVHSRALLYTDWTLTEPYFDPVLLRTRETIFTIGNGYLGTRGSFEEGYPQALPATLISGVYDDVPVIYTELANCPDWLSLVIIINGERFRLDRGDILHYERQLDLHAGVLSRFVRWRSPTGKTLEFRFERFASLADRHMLGLRCQITSIDGSGRLAEPFPWKIEVQSSLNGYPENQGFDHWEQLDQGELEQGIEQGIWLQVCTRTSHIELVMAAKIAVIGTEASFQVASPPGYHTLTTTFMAAAGQTISVEKVVTVFTSQETERPVQAAQDKLLALPSYALLLKAHQQAWEAVWQHSDIVIEGDRMAQLAVRYNLFQLIISASPQNDRVSIPAKTLSGFGYRGHIFWDTEIFILPFFTLTQPAIARSLLTYRYHALEGARRKASHSRYQGAMFPWESAATGDEVTPRSSMPTDPYAEAVRIWCRDREIHLSADIAYAVWQYWQVTGDDLWLRDYGAEIILDTARFWMSRLEWHPQQTRYELCGVIGADEYHEQVPNNAFTNRMVQWHLETAVAVYEWLQRTFPNQAAVLAQRLQLTPAQLLSWQAAIAQIYIPYNAETGLIEQFEGFFQLKDIDLTDYEPRDRSIQAVLGMDETNQRQVLKQPDVLMLLYLMRGVQAAPYSHDVLQKNWDYYAPRTDSTYGSSLTSAIHAILAADLGAPAAAYQQFMQAAMVDLDDNRGNTADGIHAASAGGVWQAVVFGFGGIQLKNSGPVATPHLPPTWSRLQFKLHWHGTCHSFDFVPSDSHTPNIQGFIFDLDGVLTDTAEWHYRAWQQLADEEHLPFDRQANEALRGVSRRESLLLIVGSHAYSELELQKMMDRKNRYYVESIQTITDKDVLPGALNLLAEIRQAGIKIAIGSASKNAKTVIEKLGLADHVDAIADGYSVEHPKPAPDLFLYAAHQLGLDPAHCVVVEDAAAGIAAAIAGGMWTIGLGPADRVDSADIVLPNLMGIHLADLQTKLSR